MDRQTYVQVDRIEGKLDELLNRSSMLLNIESREIVIGFLDKEVFDEKGLLHHLANDIVLKKFYKDIRTDDTVELEDDEEKEEYSQ
jgi:hypothetical protein